MAVTKEKSAPYAPTSAVLGIIERHRDRGVPSPIDSEVLGRAGVSDSLIPRTLQALEVLELINENGKLTDTLEALRTAPQAEYQQRLAEWLKKVYADVFSYVDPSQDDEVQVRDAFRSYNPVGQQSRMVSLFMGLCAAAGLAPEKPAKTNKPKQTSTKRAPISKRPPARKRAASTTRPNAGTEIGGGKIPSALAGLLASLPDEGKPWPKERRDRFVATFESVLDFCFPIGEPPDEDEDTE